MYEMKKKELDNLFTLFVQLTMEQEALDREKFAYASDVLRKYCVAPFSIWPISNLDIRRIMNGEISHDSLPCDPDNEFLKGMTFTRQEEFISEHMPGQMLCEARDYKSCLEEECQFFRLNRRFGVCSEFKICFKKEE